MEEVLLTHRKLKVSWFNPHRDRPLPPTCLPFGRGGPDCWYWASFFIIPQETGLFPILKVLSLWSLHVVFDGHRVWKMQSTFQGQKNQTVSPVGFVYYLDESNRGVPGSFTSKYTSNMKTDVFLVFTCLDQLPQEKKIITANVGKTVLASPLKLHLRKVFNESMNCFRRVGRGDNNSSKVHEMKLSPCSLQ